jgi:phosphatidylserine/phosphatidylglycerophosphate/cardiolipin synthase-like enzyme
MKKLFIKIIFPILCFSTVANAENILQRLQVGNDIFLKSEKVLPFFNDFGVRSRLSRWVSSPAVNSYFVDCQFNLRAFFRASIIISPVCYYLRNDDQQVRRKVFDFTDLYVTEVKAALMEISGDPSFTVVQQKKAASYFAMFPANTNELIERCMEPALKNKYKPVPEYDYSPFAKVGRCFHSSFPKVSGSPIFAINLTAEFPGHPGRVVTPSGWVGGNKIDYLTINKYDSSEQHRLEGLWSLVSSNYPITGAGSFQAMMSSNLKEVFSEREGFFTVDTDPIWNTKGEGFIFPEYIEALRAAKSTVFIDVFFLGGTMGVSFAKELVATAERGVKVVFLRDNYNHFGHQSEMLPVFNYLSAYSHKNPSKMLTLPSYIKGHSSGLPNIVSKHFKIDFLTKLGIDKHLDLYAGAKSDHSKVIVVDGDTESPIAFVGSKNLTDASGAIVYDEVIKIQGPAAAVVLDDYYYDMKHALTKELKLSSLKHYAEKGWGKDGYSPDQSVDQMAAAIISPFDLLNRDSNGRSTKRTPISVQEFGSAIVRSGYNNVNSSRTNCVTQVIQMIVSAKKNIYIKDQYLFDRSVVNALLLAKAKKPSLDIKILLEPMARANPRGMPNLLYLGYLRDAGIPVKWKTLIDGHGNIHQEYHMKSISADGIQLISGSANKDQTTMYGSFREQQLHVYDKQATKIHDQVLLEHWNDPSKSSIFSGYDFEVPNNLIGSDGKPMTPKQFVGALRGFVSLLFDATDL